MPGSANRSSSSATAGRGCGRSPAPCSCPTASAPRSRAALERLAVEERTPLRRRAEARARKVPVRLLFPLVFLVLPAFGLLTVVPALLAGFGRT